MKIVISNPKTGKTYQKEIEENKAKAIYGKKVSDIIDGDLLGISGVKLQITGGSDKQGFPMRPNFRGTKRKKLLIASGAGFKPKEKGERKRKSVRGNTVEKDIEQLNTKVIQGYEELAQEFGEATAETEETKEEPEKKEDKKETKEDKEPEKSEKPEDKEETKEESEEKPEKDEEKAEDKEETKEKPEKDKEEPEDEDKEEESEDKEEETEEAEEEKNEHECEECGKAFSSKQGLSIHKGKAH